METQPLRIRLLFEDRSILSEAQRSEGMNRSWLLIEPQHHRDISDVCNHLLHIFNLRRSCPNGIHLFMEGFVLPPFESTRVLKDKEIICVKRKGATLAEAIEAAEACNLLDEAEANMKEPVDNGMLLLANEEFDKEIGGYQSESEEVEEEKLEDEPSPKETVSKKRKASTKLRRSKKKKHRLGMLDGAEDEVPTEEINSINNDECLPMKIISKEKIKPSEESNKGNAETSNGKVKSPPNVKRKKKQGLGVGNGAENGVATEEIGNVNNDESLPRKITSKEKIKPNEETNKGSAETSNKKVKCPPNVKRSEHLQENVKGVEQTSNAPDGAKKVPSRSARRKKAKRQWMREMAKISQKPNSHPKPEVAEAENKEANGRPKGLPDSHLKPEAAEAENKEANGRPKGLLNREQVPKKPVRTNMIEQEKTNHNDDMDTEVVPVAVRPGHIRFEPLDEDEDAKQQTEALNVAFQWNGITSKKKGQKWGTEKSSTSRRNDSQKTSKEELSTKLTADTEVPVTDLNDFDKLPPCSSPKVGDVIAYRVLELSSSWTPELSSFRVGRISHYDANNIILTPVPEYPIVSDKIDEDGPDNSLYQEGGTLEIKFSALLDVRCVKQSNSDAKKTVSNGVNQTPQGDDKDAASNLVSNSNDNKANLSKNLSPVVTNKEGNTWDELSEALNAKKSELLELNEEIKRESGRNPWSYRALRGSALGPTMALLRSKNNI